MLLGREAECARIDAALDAARAQRSGSLVLRGEAGIGKTSLLEHAVERAGGFRVLRATGVESEAEIPFAGLQQLVAPILSGMADLPRPQARALGMALAIEDGPAPERLAVSMGALGVIAVAAEHGPVLCVVDDVHWLDHASADTLTFVARRLEAEGVVMLFAARELVTTMFSAPGMPELQLKGLLAPEALSLLRVTAPRLAPEVAERLVAVTEGNPLALLEIPRALGTASAQGHAPLDDPLPVSAETERAFFGRAAELSAEARRALVLVAAGDPGEHEAIRRALSSNGGKSSALAEAEATGLLEPRRLHFTHPLARSAVYHSAPKRSAVPRTPLSGRRARSQTAGLGTSPPRPISRTKR